MKLPAILIGLACAAIASAQDPQIDVLRATLTPLRAHANDRLSSDHGESRDATPALTVAKHQLRDWIETRLAKFPENGDIEMLMEEFHAGLRDAHMFCDDCFPSFLGYLDDVQIGREQGFLTVRTSAGIWCGYDDSAYAYRWVGGRWRRIWEDEQNVYTGGKYLPRILYAIHVSQAGEDGHRLLMSLGSRPGCSVSFQPVYFGVWRIGAGREKPRVLLRGTEFGNVGEFPPVKGRLTPDDALIELTVGGTGYGEGHEAVRRYKLRGDRMEQVDPIAPNPRDFVEEWLASKWERSAAWSESPSLKTWHAKLHREDGRGDFPDPTQRCSSKSGSNNGDLWQVGIKLQDVPGEIWYLVRRKAPDTFTMVAVSDQPNADCAEKARDNEWPRTFFPGVNSLNVIPAQGTVTAADALAILGN